MLLLFLQIVEQLDSDSNDDDDDDDDEGVVHRHSNGKLATPKMLYIVDDWIAFKVPMEVAVVVHQLRQKLNAILLKIVHDPVKYYSKTDSLCVDLVAQMLLADDTANLMAQPKDVGRRPISVKLNLGAHVNFGIPDQSFGHRMQQHRLKGNAAGAAVHQQQQQQFRPHSHQPANPAANHAHQRQGGAQQQLNRSQRKYGSVDGTHTIARGGGGNQERQSIEMIGKMSRYFIVKCGSEEQVRRLFSGGKWEFNMKLLNELKQIKYVGFNFLLFFLNP